MKGIVLTFCILVMVIAVNADVKASQENKSSLNNNTISHYNMGIKVKAQIAFARPPFEWILSKNEIEELKARLNNLSPTTPIPIIPLRHFLITNENKSPHFPYYQIYVCSYLEPEGLENITLIVIDKKGEKHYYEDTNNIYEWLFGLMHRYSPYPKSPPIPPNTPRMGFIQSDFFYPKVTAKQNTQLNMPAFVIFSDGTAPLEGTISVPEFITLSRQNPDRDKKVPGLKIIMNKTSVIFSIPPRTGGEGFDIEVDTSKPGELIGEIIIRSNDQNRGEIRIPVHYIITPDDKVIPEDKVVDKEIDHNIYMIVGIVLITILLSLFVIYYKKFR